MEINKVYLGNAFDVLGQFPDGSIDCCVTSPPYFGLRDYGIDGQLGMEGSPEDYICKLVEVFTEVYRCLKDDGTLWLNIGDTYATGTTAHRQQSKNPGVGANNEMAQNSVPRVGTPKGCKTKDLIGIPWMLAFALRNSGWYLRQDIIWSKPNPMPESVTDRCTKSHEYIFLLSKSERYYFDAESISEPVAESTIQRLKQDVESHQGTMIVGGGYTKPMKAKAPRFGGSKYGDNVSFQTYSGNEYHLRGNRNKRSVWTVSTHPFKEAHFATFPPTLIQPCILAGCPENGVVLDPFMGSGTTGLVARMLNRNFVGIELNPEYQAMATRRIMSEGENLFNQSIV